jgi:basic membrane protein A
MIAVLGLVAAACGSDDEPVTTVAQPDIAAAQAEVDAAQAAAAAAEANLAAAEAAAAEAAAEQQAEAQAALEAARAEAEAAQADADAAQAAFEAAQAEAGAAQAEADAALAAAEAAQAEAAAFEAALAEAIAAGDIETLATIDLDTNGDGKVILGVAAAGPRDDGAYYQALVDAAEEISAAQGWEPPVIIDNIEPAVADTELENLVAQGVDIIAVGAGEISDPLPDLVERYPDVFWYCNCGTGFPQMDGVALSTNDGAEIEYVVGYATGLLMQERGGDTAYMIGCCDLGFEVETELAMRLGLKAVDPSYDVVYTPTGNFPFDFDNVAGATEAFNVALDAGMDALYPYLGGAHEPLVQLANENDIVVMSAGASNVCERTDLHWDMAALFDGGDFARAVFPLIVSGQFEEGSIYKFSVGRDPEVGSKICGPTDEQKALLDQAHADVLNGYCLAEFDTIRAIAYGGVDLEAPLVCAEA